MALDVRRRADDRALVARVQAGEPAALAVLTARYTAWCYRWAHLSGLEVADAAQIAWLALRDAAYTWTPGPMSFLAYATLLIRRRLARAQRAAARREARCDLLPQVPAEAALVGGATPVDPAAAAIDQLTRQQLLRLLRVTCTPLERAVVAAVADGWTVAAIAVALGRRERTIRQVLQRARAKLRPKLLALGYAPPRPPARRADPDPVSPSPPVVKEARGWS